MSFSSYPSSLRYIFNKLQGFSRNRVKLPVLAPTTAAPGDTIVFELPANSKIDLSTLTWHFTLSTSITGTSASFVPPKWSAALIQQLSVDVNGINVFNCDNWNQLFTLLAAYQAGDTESTRSTILEFSRNFLNVSGVTLTNVPLAVKLGQLGFFGNGKILDTSLTGAVRVTMRLAPLTAFKQVGTSITAKSATFTNMSFTFDTVTIDDGMYDMMVQKRLAEGGVIPFCYQNILGYMGTSGSTNGLTNRIGISVQSLDYVLHSVMPSDYNSDGNTIDGTNTDINKYFIKGDSNGTITACQLQIGSTYVPSYRHDNASQILAQSLDSLNLGVDVLGSSVANFKNSPASGVLTEASIYDVFTKYYFLFAAKLCAGGSYEPGITSISGLDTRGTNMQVAATTYTNGTAANSFPITWCMFTSTLNIGAGRQLQLIM